MNHQLVIDLELPGSLDDFRFPTACNRRLHDLLDKQDAGTPLTDEERREAEYLVDLAEILSILRGRVRIVAEREAQPA